MSRFRVTGRRFWPLPQCWVSARSGAWATTIMSDAKDYIAKVDRAGDRMDRPDHRPEGAAQEARHLRVGRSAQRRRARASATARRKPRRRSAGTSACLTARASLHARFGPDAGDRAEARWHHPRHDRRARAGAADRAGRRAGHQGRRLAFGRRPGPIDGVPGVITNITTDPLEVAKASGLYAVVDSGGKAGVIIFTDSIYAIAIAKTNAAKAASRAARAARCWRSPIRRSATCRTAWASSPRRCSRNTATQWTYSVAVNDLYYDFAAPSLQNAGIDPAKGYPRNISAGDGSVPAFQRIRDGQYQVATVAEPLYLHGWQTIDELNRAFAGEQAERLRGAAASVHPGEPRQGRRRQQHLRSGQRLPRPVQEDLGRPIGAARLSDQGATPRAAASFRHDARPACPSRAVFISETRRRRWPTTTSKPAYATQHAPRRLQRPGRPLRRRADHGAQGLRLYRPHLLQGLQVVDVRDPKNPKAVKYVAAPPNTWTLHLQAHDDLLLVIHNKDMFAQPELADEKNYYKGKVDHPRQAGSRGAQLVGRHGGLRHLEARRPASRSASCRSRAPACTASGTSAGAGPMPRRCSTASPTTSSSPSTCRTRRSRARRKILAAGHERRRRREGQLADQERPLRPAPCDHPRRHRLLQLARRLPRGRRRQGQGQSEADRPQDLGAALRRRHAQCAAAPRPQSARSSSTRPCSTTRRTASSRSGCSTTR